MDRLIKGKEQAPCLMANFTGKVEESLINVTNASRRSCGRGLKISLLFNDVLDAQSRALKRWNNESSWPEGDWINVGVYIHSELASIPARLFAEQPPPPQRCRPR